MAEAPAQQPIVVYLVDRPAFARSRADTFISAGEPAFDSENGLESLIGPYDPDEVHVLIDDLPAGPAWEDLIQGLVEERVHTVVTQLAPLSSGQRQQLIGVCALTGARLVTLGSAGGAVRS